MELEQVLATIPSTLRDELLEVFRNIERNFREGRWEPAELNGGKLCEVVFSIIEGYARGNYPVRAAKPGNMVAACLSMEKLSPTFPRSVRIQIPRMLIALYEIRNNRGVGHVGGDVNPNHMDAVCVLQMAKWIMAELVRLFHGVSIDDAARTVDSLSDREVSVIWQVNDVRRVLDTSLSMLDKTLILLYGSPTGLSETELVKSVEHSNPSVYRRDVLRLAHKRRLLEYDERSRIVTISPVGSQAVERKIHAFLRKR